MNSFDERMKLKLADKKKEYLNTIKKIKENMSLNYVAFILAKRWNEEYRTTGDKATYNIQLEGGMVRIYLGKEQNVTKDFMLFLDENREIIENQVDSEMEIRTDAHTVDYLWNETWNKTFSIWVYFGGSNCERVLVRSDVTTTTNHVYEMVCH